MSRLSDAKAFKEANEKIVETISEIDDSNIIERLILGGIADTAHRCLMLLAEIADMMERSEDGNN